LTGTKTFNCLSKAFDVSDASLRERKLKHTQELPAHSRQNSREAASSRGSNTDLFYFENAIVPAQETTQAKTPAQMSRYLIGAVLALALDYAIVWGALRLGLHPWFARALGLLAGVTTTYFFNRRYTFDISTKPSVAEWSRYFAMQLIGSALNFAVSTVGLYFGDRSTLHIALAVGAGAAIGFSYNFFAARRVLQR
jgi:putative flippase GtrA